MNKYLLSVGVIIAFVVYALNQPTKTAVLPIENSSQTTTESSSNPSISYKDGEYTGSNADATYGNVQVKAVISGGKITDVQFLDYPKDRDNSLEISNQSMPILKSEAIKAQTAEVDIVSGATQTSEAFKQSLQAALSQAQG